MRSTFRVLGDSKDRKRPASLTGNTIVLEVRALVNNESKKFLEITCQEGVIQLRSQGQFVADITIADGHVYLRPEH